MSDFVIGLQLYTVRDETAKDFVQTIHRVAEMGYSAVEFAGYGNLSSKEMAALLAATGLRVAGTHVGLHALEQDLSREINYCLEIGCPYLIVPYLQPELRNAHALPKLAAQLNEIGQHCQERGISLGYHNHDFEFAASDDGLFLDNLLAATDPALVKWEMDSYWTAYAGIDPIAYIKRYSGRIPLIHLKDMTPDRTFSEVGDGTLNIASYIQAARNSGTRFGIVENDHPRIPSLESARRSLENLKKLV